MKKEVKTVLDLIYALNIKDEIREVLKVEKNLSSHSECTSNGYEIYKFNLNYVRPVLVLKKK